MKHICMDCKTVLLETPNPAWQAAGDEPVSHGLCGRCKDVRIEEHKAAIARRAERSDMDVPVEVLA